MRRFFVTLLLGLLAPSAGLAVETHPFSIHDMLAMQRISDAQVSPDGRSVVFNVRTTDLEANRGRFDIWMAKLDGSGARQVTTHPEADYGARWMPDGKSFLFLSTRSGSSQVWRLRLDGGEATQVTDLPLDVANLVIAPDGKRIAVTMDVFPDCDTVQCTVDRKAAEAARKSSGRLYERIFVRHWDTWKDGTRAHLFVVPLDGGEAVDVMPGMDADTPSKPWGGTEEITFTPDSRGIVFTAKDVGREEAWSTNFDLFLAPVDASQPPRNLTAANPAWDTGPTFSPDGKTLAYLAMARPGYESDQLRIHLMDWPSGRTRALTKDWDRSPRELVWGPRGRRLYASSDHLGQHAIFAIDARTGEARAIVVDGTTRGIQPYGKRILYARDSLQSPVELWTAEKDGDKPRQLTHLNDGRIARARLGEAEQFRFEGAHGDEVWAWLVKPADFDPSKRYPVAFLVHGGPQGSFGDHFHYRWNPQAYAGAGYAVVMVDFHGSTGYGQAFTDAIRGDWGGAPYEDLIKGLDAALAGYAFLDGERVCALGASYGGYMIFWIAGQTDRFQCLVAHDGNLDERFAYFDTEELWFPEWDHEGTPWDNPEGYSRHNPLEHVANWKTPMLVIHGALDFRVVDTQGLGAFNVLQRRGIPSQLLHFPDENHWVLKPANSIQWHETVLAWLHRWSKK